MIVINSLTTDKNANKIYIIKTECVYFFYPTAKY